MEELAEASKLLERAKELSSEERAALNFFLQNISVGELRALRELKREIPQPAQAIRKLLSLGLLEEGEGCYNLAKPLREYVMRKGRLRV
ncbi:MAG: hypothetical protein NZ902_03430 [Acidilobaceae archaeon]|nr:hypothetical protein [Acidilobaceae archaeon]MCX8165219.1 hypothetical protein [Acidilobaceae archaeon]MDW7974265.1 hypothetical protein [Sulfolobales archaeon]